MLAIKKSCFLLLITIFSIINLYAQDYSIIENITKESRLQNHIMNCMVQDEQGFLWIGTNFGLYRYDGYRFVGFSVNSNPSVLNNNIKTLLVDGENLWIGSKGGINILNTINKSMVNLTSDVDDHFSIPDNFISKIYKDKQNKIWVGYNSGFISSYEGEGKFINYSLGFFEADYKVNEYLEIKPQTFIIKLVNIKNQSAKIIQSQFNEGKLVSKLVYENKSDKQQLISVDSEVYLIDENEIKIFDPKGQNFISNDFMFSGGGFSNGLTYTDNESNVYFGTTKNVFYWLDIQDKTKFNKITLGIDKNLINFFYVDKTGLLWVGTTAGLYKLKKKHYLFNKYLVKNDIETNKMRSIFEDSRGEVFAVNQKDIFKLDTLSKVFNNLNWDDQIDSSPYSVIENDSTSFLIGTQGRGVALYDKETNLYQSYSRINKHLDSNTHVLKLFRDKNQLLWIGTLEGLCYYDEKKDKIYTLDQSIFKNEVVFEIKRFKNSELLIGTSKGIYILKINYNKNPIEIDISKFENLSYEIRSVVVSKDYLWAATQSKGIVRYNLKLGSVKIIDEAKGLSNNCTYSILPGIKNELWVGTLNGLSRYDTINKEILNFYEYDGLANNEFNSSSQLISSEGLLYFGGQNGISSFNPLSFTANDINLNLNITNVNWYNSKKDSTYSVDVNNDLKKLKLPYHNAFVHFEFSLSDFFKPENNTFKYKFVGLNNEWRVLNKTNILTLTNLPPGDYILEVMASTNYGKWNIQHLLLPIEVSQIFYKRWWFLTLLGVFVLLFIYLVRKYELYHLKKMEKLRLRIARDLHDELGSILTGIAIRSELINEKIDSKKRTEFLQDMAVQSRGAVDTLSDLVWAIDSRNNSLNNLNDRMHNVLYQLLSPQNITFNFNSLATKKAIELNQEHRQHVFLIFKEAVTNIIKHSNATHVDVSISKNKYSLKLTVKDNGTQFVEEDNNLNGNGFRNMKTRAEKINGKLKFIHEEGFKVELLFDFMS